MVGIGSSEILIIKIFSDQFQPMHVQAFYGICANNGCYFKISKHGEDLCKQTGY